MAPARSRRSTRGLAWSGGFLRHNRRCRFRDGCADLLRARFSGGPGDRRRLRNSLGRSILRGGLRGSLRRWIFLIGSTLAGSLGRGFLCRSLLAGVFLPESSLLGFSWPKSLLPTFRTSSGVRVSSTRSGWPPCPSAEPSAVSCLLISFRSSSRTMIFSSSPPIYRFLSFPSGQIPVQPSSRPSPLRSPSSCNSLSYSISCFRFT